MLATLAVITIYNLPLDTSTCYKLGIVLNVQVSFDGQKKMKLSLQCLMLRISAYKGLRDSN